MRPTNFAGLLAAIALTMTACAHDTARLGRAPNGSALVIAHRGASAYLPEHTLAAYQLAIEQGADVVEPDLVVTRDGVLVARHENEIGGTTDVVDKPQFASRRTTKQIDGVPVTGWFAEDFTLAELKSLRARERIPANRPDNVKHNDRYEVPTLDEVIRLVKDHERTTGRRVAIYPETKHPSYFRSIGKPLEESLVKTLHDAGFRGKEAPVFIQSFEVANLKSLRKMTDLPLVQLINNPRNRPAANGTPQNAPWDFILAGDKRTYADMVSPKGLAEVAGYADAVGAYKEIVIPRSADNRLASATSFVKDAHAAGLAVHIWTMRPENVFLPVDLRRGEVTSPSARGDAVAEIQAYLGAGIDGFFSDDPLAGRQAVDAFTK